MKRVCWNFKRPTETKWQKKISRTPWTGFLLFVVEFCPLFIIHRSLGHELSIIYNDQYHFIKVRTKKDSLVVEILRFVMKNAK